MSSSTSTAPAKTIYSSTLHRRHTLTDRTKIGLSPEELDRHPKEWRSTTLGKVLEKIGWDLDQCTLHGESCYETLGKLGVKEGYTITGPETSEKDYQKLYLTTAGSEYIEKRYGRTLERLGLTSTNAINSREARSAEEALSNQGDVDLAGVTGHEVIIVGVDNFENAESNVNAGEEASAMVTAETARKPGKLARAASATCKHFSHVRNKLSGSFELRGRHLLLTIVTEADLDSTPDAIGASLARAQSTPTDISVISARRDVPQLPRINVDRNAPVSRHT